VRRLEFGGVAILMVVAIMGFTAHAALADDDDPFVEESERGDGVTISVFLSQSLADDELVNPPEIGLAIIIRTADDGSLDDACYQVAVHVGDGASEEHHADMDELMEQLSGLGVDSWVNFPRCPLEEGEVSEEEAISQFVATVPMPIPDPHIAPGRAITGLRAFLETGIDAESVAPIVVDVLAGTVMIDPRPSEVEVDWGDGTHPLVYEGEAGPWPDGEVVYAYVERGLVTVRVLQRWDAHWSYEGLLGHREGVVSGLWSYGEITDFPVNEVQAVRER
jgi:hypothetical protein